MIRLICAIVLLLGATVAAQAQGLDMSKGGPIEVTSRDGIEWRQNDQLVIARGDARAVRGASTVLADTLTARYRHKANQNSAAAVTPSATAVSTGSIISGGDSGANEIYRLEADGHVKIFNATDIAVGDHAIYDIDQAVLILTGKNLSLTTPNHIMTARDTLEWWSQKHMAVGRGLATVTTSDGKRLSADVLVGYTAPDQPAAATPVVAKSGSSAAAAAAGKLQKVEAFGHVEVRTATETITGERGVYIADSDIARIVGHVHITRGMNQLNGDEALVNMKTGISTLVRDPGARVQGLIVPNDESTRAAPGGAPAAKPGKK